MLKGRLGFGSIRTIIPDKLDRTLLIPYWEIVDRQTIFITSHSRVVSNDSIANVHMCECVNERSRVEGPAHHSPMSH